MPRRAQHFETLHDTPWYFQVLPECVYHFLRGRFGLVNMEEKLCLRVRVECKQRHTYGLHVSSHLLYTFLAA